jgi:hypothetical protein
LDIYNTGEFQLTSFEQNLVPVIRMRLGYITTIDPVHINLKNLVNISPNPATDHIHVQIDLIDFSKEVSIEIIEINGKSVYTKRLHNIKSANQIIDIKELPIASYMLKVKTDKDSSYFKFIKQ